MLKKFKRWQVITAIAIVVIALLTIFAAPSTNPISEGSIYNRSPDGYGAWYEYMKQKNFNIQPWQKTFKDLADSKQTKVTLLQISTIPTSEYIGASEQQWIDKGNTLIILGVRARATQADFKSTFDSSFGAVQIDTTKRNRNTEDQLILGDRFGAVIWQKKFVQSEKLAKSSQGKVIFSTTPYLAANAYQDRVGNYALLADLVSQNGQKIFVDEFMHGYRDSDVLVKEGKGNLIDYLKATPLAPALLQLIIVIAALVWGYNHRFGLPAKLETPSVDNSTAYMSALSAVLQKAESSDFVITTLSKAEQLHLQQALGLGKILLEPEALILAWQQQTGRSAGELSQVLRSEPNKQKVSEAKLLVWLAKWQAVRSRLSN